MFEKLNAVSAGIGDIRRIVDEARQRVEVGVDVEAGEVVFRHEFRDLREQFLFLAADAEDREEGESDGERRYERHDHRVRDRRRFRETVVVEKLDDGVERDLGSAYEFSAYLPVGEVGEELLSREHLQKVEKGHFFLFRRLSGLFFFLSSDEHVMNLAMMSRERPAERPGSIPLKLRYSTCVRKGGQHKIAAEAGYGMV